MPFSTESGGERPGQCAHQNGGTRNSQCSIIFWTRCTTHAKTGSLPTEGRVCQMTLCLELLQSTECHHHARHHHESTRPFILPTISNRPKMTASCFILKLLQII